MPESAVNPAVRLPRVHVLLSTYNGARYLSRQLESLSSQDYPNFRLHVRDDGSDDDTVRILRDHARQDQRLMLECGPNLGVVPSFFELLKAGGGLEDLYALCDQDDVWLPNKLSAAVTALMRAPDPSSTLYCAAVRYVDADLRPIRDSSPPKVIGFGNALLENVATGCTTVFGDRIRAIAVGHSAEGVQMHDWWLYLIAAAYGEVLFDPEPRILYRQHGANASAWQPSRSILAARRLILLGQRLRSGRLRLSGIEQAAKLLGTAAAPLPDDKAALLLDLLELRERGSVLGRLRLMHSGKVRHNSLSADYAWRALLLLGWF